MKSSVANKIAHLFTVVFFPFFILLQSSLAPYANKLPNPDSGVFMYCANRITNGSLMYKDVFDHKGPVTYLFHILGLQLLNGDLLGIWLLEMLFLIVTAVFLYKTAFLITADRWLSYPVTIYSLLLLAPSLDNASGYSREILLPFISTSLYFYVKSFYHDCRMPVREIISVAFCCTMCLLMLPNTISLWVVFSLVLICHQLSKKEYGEFFRYSTCFIVMVVVTAAPFILYAVSHNILSDALYCIWTFNALYSDVSVFSIAKGVYVTLKNLDVGYATLIMMGYLWSVFCRWGKLPNRGLHIGIILSCLLSVVLGCAWSGRDYRPYTIVCMPLICVNLAYVVAFIECHFKIKKVTVAVVLLVMSWQLVAYQGHYIRLAYERSDETLNLVTIIKNNSNAADKIAIVGNDSQLYLLSNRSSMSKYHFTWPIFDSAKLTKELWGNYGNEILNVRPKLILVNNILYPKLPENIAGVLREKYKVIYSGVSAYDLYKYN